MVAYQCLRCGESLHAPESCEALVQTCPRCGNVNAVPAPPRDRVHEAVCPSPAQQLPGQAIIKPTLAPVIAWGLGLYITSFVLGILAEVADARGIGWLEELLLKELLPAAPPKPELSVLLVVGIILAFADLLGVIMATLGYAWGAVLRIVLFFPSVVFYLITPTLITPIPGTSSHSREFWVFYSSSFFVSIASFICYIVPPAWQYYRECKRYRLKRLLA